MSRALHPRRAALVVLWIALALAGVAAAAAALRHHTSRAASPPVLATLPEFALLDSEGSGVDPARLAGRPYVASFIFTRCGGICPAMTARLVRLRPALPRDVRFVSFTVDPQHDTPEALRAYARAQGAQGEWLFVTGTREALHSLSTQGFKLAAYEVPPEEQRAGGDGPFLHSSKLVLVDGAGRVRGYYDSTDEGALAALEREARALLPGAP